MAILKCKMCGGTLDYDRTQNLAICPYCGSKSTVFDQDRKLFEQFQNQFAALLNRPPSTTPEEGFWVEASQETLIREDGKPIEISYLTKCRVDLCTMYVARHSVIYVFEDRYSDYAVRYQDMTERITYPTPEMKRELSNYLPERLAQYRLTDGSIFLAIAKKEGVYPLKMLGILTDRHVAWVVSRLENLCCLLEYNDMVLNAFTIENLFVDPANHQIYLYGGWWFAGFQGTDVAGASQDVKSCLEKANGMLPRPAGRTKNHIRTDLRSIRLAAAKLLGYPDRASLKNDTILPKPFQGFLMREPEPNASADFSKWDRTLLDAYGERKFIPLVMTEEEIYSRDGENS